MKIEHIAMIWEDFEKTQSGKRGYEIVLIRIRK